MWINPGIVLLTSAALIAAAGFEASRTQADSTVQKPTTQPFASIDAPGLPNAHRVTEKIISGAQPEGDEAFKTLRDMGVRTILSVDGAQPDVATAHRFGLRYVHLPITYSGVTAEQGRAIAKALKELPGPIYVHCHHGKHRSAAAVAVACVFNGMLKPEQAESVLRTFGTGKNYKGLWQAARDARPLDDATLDAVKVKYVEAAEIPELAEAMVALDETWDRVKLVQKAGWRTPESHPDLDPAHEALQLQEHLKEISRTGAVKNKPADFQRTLHEGEEAADALRTALAASAARAADVAATRVAASCAACHKAFRD